MIKISTAVRDIIDGNSFLKLGLQQNLLNLSAVAGFIQPLVEVRTKKSVQKSAILMNLSRLKSYSDKFVLPKDQFFIRDLSVRSNLYSISYYRRAALIDKVGEIYDESKKFDSYITMNQGVNEVTFLLGEKLFNKIQKIISDEPKYTIHDLSAITVHFDEKFVDTPGLIYYLIQQLTMQGINICEISSTYTELIMYVKSKDVKLAFDTIYSQFLG